MYRNLRKVIKIKIVEQHRISNQRYYQSKNGVYGYRPKIAEPFKRKISMLAYTYNWKIHVNFLIKYKLRYKTHHIENFEKQNKFFSL